MLYMKSDDGDLKIIVLESAQLKKLEEGSPIRTPDNSVLIAWTPDPAWLAEQLMKCDGAAARIGELIDEAAKRPQQPVRPLFESTEMRLGPPPE